MRRLDVVEEAEYAFSEQRRGISATRQDWMSARDALQAASRIVLMGYSAPVTDLTVASLLSNYADPNVPVCVVDRSPDDIVTRLHKLGLTAATSFQKQRSDRAVRRAVRARHQCLSYRFVA